MKIFKIFLWFFIMTSMPLLMSGFGLKDSLIKIDSIYRFEPFIGFKYFKVEIYNGKLAAPDFNNNPYANDNEYVKFISDGCEKLGINFGGHYTIIERFCGAECVHFFIVDRINGKIFLGIKPNDGRYGYKYYKDSNLFIANAYAIHDDTFEYDPKFRWVPEIYKWNNELMERLK